MGADPDFPYLLPMPTKGPKTVFDHVVINWESAGHPGGARNSRAGRWTSPGLPFIRTSDGRFGAGLPDVGDASFLFLQHMISKMTPLDKGGSVIGIVFNGSPLFNGDAGSGWSDIRKWIIQNDWLDAIVALPEDMFYNTNIATYLWIVRNNKPTDRRGTITLVDGNQERFRTLMRRNLGKKRVELTTETIAELVHVYRNNASLLSTMPSPKALTSTQK
jgi:type I restriction-modification system DNA methylase subunit